jgi:hypothetical protein
MRHLQEEVCPKDEKFYAMGIHLKIYRATYAVNP